MADKRGVRWHFFFFLKTPHIWALQPYRWRFTVSTTHLLQCTVSLHVYNFLHLHDPICPELRQPTLCACAITAEWQRFCKKQTNTIAYSVIFNNKKIVIIIYFICSFRIRHQNPPTILKWYKHSYFRLNQLFLQRAQHFDIELIWLNLRYLKTAWVKLCRFVAYRLIFIYLFDLFKKEVAKFRFPH